ncbi:hypothetical protein ACAX43_24390 [Paraburkholderia sp. IW21]|uniref:hypothetical protein n=1 Tax=Paraburkholderia sp. IW21 TaxID=3242488 RepID=UPI00351FEFF9
MLRVRPGAVLTVIGWTFGVFDWGTEGGTLETAFPEGALAADGLAALGLLADPVWDVSAGVPPPPPQPTSVTQTRSRAWR